MNTRNIQTSNYDGLNETAPHRLKCLHAWTPVSGPLEKRFGGMPMLEEV